LSVVLLYTLYSVTLLYIGKTFGLSADTALLIPPSLARCSYVVILVCFMANK